MQNNGKTVASAETSPPPLLPVQFQEPVESALPDFLERCPSVNGLFSLDLEAWLDSCFVVAVLMSPKLPKKKVPQKQRLLVA